MDIESELEHLPGQNGTASHALAALKLIQDKGIPVHIDDNAGHQIPSFNKEQE